MSLVGWVQPLQEGFETVVHMCSLQVWFDRIILFLIALNSIGAGAACKEGGGARADAGTRGLVAKGLALVDWRSDANTGPFRLPFWERSCKARVLSRF